jgi:hypothetical protein
MKNRLRYSRPLVVVSSVLAFSACRTSESGHSRRGDEKKAPLFRSAEDLFFERKWDQGYFEGRGVWTNKSGGSRSGGVTIKCWQDRRVCFVAESRTDEPPYLDVFDLVNWDSMEISARNEGGLCMATEIRVDRSAKKSVKVVSLIDPVGCTSLGYKPEILELVSFVME